jgi:lipopolysaccharide export system permease protein
MMGRLDRHVAATIGSSFLTAMAALLAVFSVINFTQELREVGSGHYRMADALRFVILTLPSEAYKLFPAAALLGTVNGLGALARQSELIAMSASGVSRGRLTWYVLQAAICLMVAATLLGELVAAPLAQRARTQRSVAVTDGSVLSTVNGIWARDGATFVNVRAPFIDGAMRDVYMYELDGERQLRRVVHAASATHEGGAWALTGLVESRIGPRGVASAHIDRRTWQTSIDPEELRILLLPPEDLSVLDLARSIGAFRERGENPRQHELAFWRRLTMPAVTGIMVVLGIPFVLTALRAAALGQRVVAGALVGIGYQMFADTFGRFGLVYGLDPLTSAVFPALVALAAFVMWMQQTY